MKTKKFLILAILFTFLGLESQNKEKNIEVLTVAFYNVENLFDTINDTTIRDEASPIMEMNENVRFSVYEKKLNNISAVIADIGRDLTKRPPVIVGLCEVENRKVVEDLVKTEILKNYNYGIIHFDSPDERGIDVSLIYQQLFFTPKNLKSYSLKLYDSDGDRDFTRDQLLVNGDLLGEEINFLVHHWPSRSGGQKTSEPKRIEAAKLNKKIIDSLINLNYNSKIINMGDFNDDPVNKSISQILDVKQKIMSSNFSNYLYNAMFPFFKNGIGTSAYRNNWNVLDQIHVSSSLLNKENKGWLFWKANIFNKPFLINKEGRYKGYPFRSFAGGKFLGGYSDHFPVYLYLFRELN